MAMNRREIQDSGNIRTYIGKAPSYIVRKTIVDLREEEAEGLRMLAGATGESQAELIREGVRRLLREGVSRTFHSMGKGEGPGGPRPRWDPDGVRDETRYPKMASGR
jgi:hypothetical protein